MNRPCAHCGERLPVTAPPNQKYCRAVKCQDARKAAVNRALAERRKEQRRQANQVCEICGAPATNRTCDKPECRTELRKRVGRANYKRREQKYVLTKCLGLYCNKVFKSPKGSDGKALYHKCLRCRRVKYYNEVRFAEGVWGGTTL